MGKCKDCEHWGLGRFHEGTECHKGLYLGDGAKVLENEFGCMDMEGYDAAIYTGSEFGCVLFEEKGAP